jgi:hypothetical protein
MFSNCISSSYTNRNSAFANEGGNVGCGQEDECDGKVLDESNIESIFTAELNICALKKVKSGLQ